MSETTASVELLAAIDVNKAAKNKIDLQKLAEEVFRLLKKEMMLENERRGWRGGPHELN